MSRATSHRATSYELNDPVYGEGETYGPSKRVYVNDQLCSQTQGNPRLTWLSQDDSVGDFKM